MKAVIRRKYCPENEVKIEIVDKPVLKPGHALIKVYASTVNRTDCHNVTGSPWIMRLVVGFRAPKLPITGTDFAGVIEDIDKDSTKFSKGDKVFGFYDQGAESHSEYMVISTQHIHSMPKNQSFIKAASSMEGPHYAMSMVSKTKVKSGDKILINGATGGIGSAAFQICKYLGANIDVVVDTENIEKFKEMGAENIFDWKTSDFTKSDKKYDIIIDSVGKSSFSKCKRLLESKGIYTSSELGKWASNIWLSLLTPLFFGKRVVFPIPEDMNKTVGFMIKIIEEEKYTPLIDKVFNIDDTASAFDYVAKGLKTGNVVISIAEE